MKTKFRLEGIEDLQRDLHHVRAKAVPHAMRNALNDEAFAARKAWQGNLKKKLTLRSRFTDRSVRVDKARGTNMRTMRSVVGSVADYLPEQEFGAAVPKSAIPTGVASGEGRIPGSERRRLVRRPNLKRNIRLPRPIGGPGKRRVAATIAQAKRKKQRFVLLEDGLRKGIFRVGGGKRKTKLSMVYDLSHRAITKKARPTLGPALEKVIRRAPAIHRRALKAQFRRAGLRPWV